jgi:hypothetical protein
VGAGGILRDLFFRGSGEHGQVLRKPFFGDNVIDAATAALAYKGKGSQTEIFRANVFSAGYKKNQVFYRIILKK